MFDDSDSEEEMKDSVNYGHKKLNVVLSEKNDPDNLFWPLFCMIEDYKIAKKNFNIKELTQDDLDQIETLFSIKQTSPYISEIKSYFCNLNDDQIIKMFSLLKNLKVISEFSFNNCKHLTHIEIPENVISIGDYTFNACENLEKVKLPNTLESIGEWAFNWAFNGATKITSIKLPESLIKISKGGLAGLGITKIIVPSKITILNDATFAWNEKLTSVTLPEGLISIDNHCFWRCINLKEITLPRSLQQISPTAFEDCTALKVINVAYPSTREDIFLNYDPAFWPWPNNFVEVHQYK